MTKKPSIGHKRYRKTMASREGINKTNEEKGKNAGKDRKMLKIK